MEITLRKQNKLKCEVKRNTLICFAKKLKIFSWESGIKPDYRREYTPTILLIPIRLFLTLYQKY